MNEPVTSVTERGKLAREKPPSGGARGRSLTLCACVQQVSVGRAQACGSWSRSRWYHQMVMSQFPLVFFPSVYSLLLSSSSSINAVKHILFVEVYLFRSSYEMGWLSVFLSNAQIFIAHSGRLIPMSFSCGQKTSYFEIPLSLYPRSRTNLRARFFLLRQLWKFFWYMGS